MRIAPSPNQANDFEIYSNDSLKSAFVSIAGIVRIGAFVISLIALVAGIDHEHPPVSVTERTKILVPEIDRRAQPRYPPEVPDRGGFHFGSWWNFGDFVRGLRKSLGVG